MNVNDFDIIRCRAKISADCEDGDKAFYDIADDGTYNDATGTVICDVCYWDLMPFTPSGMGLLDELPAAILAAREKVVNDERR